MPATQTLRIGVSDPSVFSGNVYALVIDPGGILAGGVQLVATGAAEYAATVHTSATLPAGRHQGSFDVRLCRDPACAAQYPGSPVALPYDVTITQQPLQVTASAATDASAHAGGAAPADITVALVAPDGNWTASTDASWLRVLSGTGSGPGSFTVRYAVQGLTPGVYRDKATVRSRDGQSAEVYFSLTVLPTEFSITADTPQFTAINGAPIATQTLAFDLGSGIGSPWTATTDASWLTLSPNAGTTPASIAVQVNPSNGRLASGAHTADVRLSSPGATEKVVTSTLTLLRPTLAFASPSITLGGAMGRDLSPQTVQLNLNTGTNEWPWALQTLPSWLSASATAGMVGYRTAPLELAPSSAAGAGSTSGVVTAVVTVNGDTVTAPVTVNLNLDQRRLAPSQWAVGFASTPLGADLRRTLRVKDSFGKSLAWSARTSAPWLTVTPVGTTGDDASLVLTADPALLPDATVSEAIVTLESSTAGVEGANIRVGLWKSSVAAATKTTVPASYHHVVADKFRPYIYAHARGADIDIFHAYTAQKIGTVRVPGATLAEMAMSPDGTTLYALNPADRTIAVIDTTSRTHTAAWPMEKAIDRPTAMVAIRPSGVDVVLLGNGSAFARGRLLAPTNLLANTLAASVDGSLVYALNRGISNAWAYLADYSDAANGALSLQTRATRQALDQYDAAFAPFGSAYIASGNARQCAQVDAQTMAPIRELTGATGGYPNSVEVTSDGRPLCGLVDSSGAADLLVYSVEGYFRVGYRVAAVNRFMYDMVVAADGMVAVALTNEPSITFVPIGR